jgi:nucleotide-binding universal stress UspA family protein
MKKILIAIDDGPNFKKVATIGYQLGQQLKAEIALISVVDSILLMTGDGVTSKDMEEMIKNDFRKSHKLIIDTVCKDNKIQTFVEDGIPAEMILKIAKKWKADIIVLGTHGRSGIERLLMGSVAEHVIRNSTKPLFIVPTK